MKSEQGFTTMPPEPPEDDNEPAIEDGQEPVPRDELKRYTKEHDQEGRDRLAREISAERQDYFKEHRNAAVLMERVRELIDQKTAELNEIVQEMQEIEGAISDKSSSLFTRILEHSKIKKLQRSLEGREPTREVLQRHLDQLLADREQLSEQLTEKMDVASLRMRVDEFYTGHIDDFRQHAAEQQRRELERLAEEEQLRQVDSIMKQYEGFCVHGIIDRWAPTSNSLMKENATFESKLKLALALEPTFSTSIIQRGDQASDMWAQMGLIVTRGRVEAAHIHDAATRALGVTKRASGFGKNSMADIEKAVPGGTGGMATYNEFIVSNPKVSGMYLSAYRHDQVKRVIPDGEFFSLAEKLGLPTFYVKNGEVFAVSFNEESGELDIGEKITPEKMSDMVQELDEAQKEQLLQEVFEKEMPFEIERMLPEARKFAARSDGQSQYFKIAGDAVSATAAGETVSIHELGIDPNYADYTGKRYLQGGEVRVVSEVKRPSGRVDRYFTNGGKLYRQEWNWRDDTATKEFRPITQDVMRDSRHISLGFNSWKLDKPPTSPDAYLGGMAKSITGLKEEMAQADVNDSKAQEQYTELLDRLAYHVYGFADTAQTMGDTAAYERAVEIASSVVPLDQYEQSKQERLAADGTFIVKREDLT